MSSPRRTAFVFADVSRAGCFWTFVRNLPRLADGELTSCDIVAGGESKSVCVAKFRSAELSGKVRERLSFWATALGGRQLEGDSPDLAPDRCRATTWDDVAAPLVPLVADALATGRSGFTRDLFVDVERWRVELVKLEQASTTLFVRSDVAPPLGDTLLIGRVPGAGPAGTAGFVTASVTARLQRGSGECARGFTVEVAADERFTAWAASLPARYGGVPWRIREQRIPLRAIGAIVPEAGGASTEVMVENVSRTGALLVGCPELAVGARVTVSFSIAGIGMMLRGNVARLGADGTGVRFDGDPFANLRLATQIERLTDPPPRALIVDDDGLARRMLADCMAERGFEVMTAPDGDAAVGLLRDQLHCIDAVITDLCMPGTPSDELVRRLRSVVGREYIPIIAMTGTATPEAVRRMEAAGVDVVLSKSAGPQSIAEIACDLARMRQPQRAGAVALAPA